MLTFILSGTRPTIWTEKVITFTSTVRVHPGTARSASGERDGERDRKSEREKERVRERKREKRRERKRE